MSNKKRVPKAEYFRMRYQNAVENNLTEKAEYFKSRLISMGKWEVVQDEDFPYIPRKIKTHTNEHTRINNEIRYAHSYTMDVKHIY